MQTSKTEVIAGIRACLISTKGRTTLRQLDSDYYAIVGERIPFREFGFKRLEEFLQSEPTLLVTNNGGQLFVCAKSSEKSAHITDMVAKQKTSKKPVPKVRFNMPAPRFNKPFAQPQRWRPKNYAAMPNRWKTSTRPQQVAHSQFVERTTEGVAAVDVRRAMPTVTYPGVPQNAPKTAGVQGRLNAVRPTMQSRLRVDAKPAQNNVGGNSTTEEPCAVLSNARKRITRKMSDLDVDSASDDNSPTNDLTLNSPKSPARTPEFHRTGDAMVDLKNLIKIYKIAEMDVSLLQIKSKKREIMWTCTIRIGKHVYQSYPNEFSTDMGAQMYAAEEALKDLCHKYENRRALLISSEKDIFERIPPMLEKHNHGIWVWQLRLDYVDKYNEELPEDFLKIIDSSPTIQVEKCLEDYVLRHCRPGDVLQKGKMNPVMMAPMVSVMSNTVQFGQDGRLFAMVTYVVSANEIWCRQCSTEESDLYSDMMGRLEVYYCGRESNLRPKAILGGGYYVAKFDANYYRVRALEVSGGEVNCFFIDIGDETTIPVEDIFELRREFAVAQAQAFVCQLVGLEELYDVSAYSESLQKILYRQVILESAGDNPLYAVMESNLPVYMYDYETEASINQQMIPLLMMESAAPNLKMNAINEVYVSNIEANGDVYVQMHSPGYETLQELLQNVESRIVSNPPDELLARKITPENSKEKLYLGQYELDRHWYRLKLIDWSPDKCYAQTYYVDYGNTGTVDIRSDKLYPIDALSEVLDQYPPQAVRVRIDLPEIPTDFVDVAKKVMPESQPILLKVTGVEEDGMYRAEFFRRDEDEGLFCVNKHMAFEAELKSGDGNNNKHVKRKYGPNVPSAGTLPKPSLPKRGEYFEVHVPFAVNPYNFFVQPLNSRPKLYNMMEKLQDTYKDVQYSPLQVDQIVPGNIYASRHEDGIWYRTSVIKVINSGSISVFYCDFGYYASLTVQQLLPLDVEFVQLPYQAIKAKLSDIKPQKNKWTMEDCEVFRELVAKKNLYSILMDIERDVLYESDIVLKLILIDTSFEDKDLCIGKELIERGIAIGI